MGPQSEFLETVLTCKGNYYAPDFSSRLDDLKCRLQKLVIPDSNKNLEVKKVEPWNSVKVTLKLPANAAYKLKQLAEQRDGILREIGILAVQIEGHRAISLTMDHSSQSPITSTLNNNVYTSNQSPVINVPSAGLSKTFNSLPISGITTMTSSIKKQPNEFSKQCQSQSKNSLYNSMPTKESVHACSSSMFHPNNLISSANSNFVLPMASVSHTQNAPLSYSSSMTFCTQSMNTQYQNVDNNMNNFQSIASSSPLLVNLLKSPGGRGSFNNLLQLPSQSFCEAMESGMMIPAQKRKRNQTKRSKRLKESCDLNYSMNDKYPGSGISFSSSSSSLTCGQEFNMLSGQCVYSSGLPHSLAHNSSSFDSLETMNQYPRTSELSERSVNALQEMSMTDASATNFNNYNSIKVNSNNIPLNDSTINSTSLSCSSLTAFSSNYNNLQINNSSSSHNSLPTSYVQTSSVSQGLNIIYNTNGSNKGDAFTHPVLQCSTSSSSNVFQSDSCSIHYNQPTFITKVNNNDTKSSSSSSSSLQVASSTILTPIPISSCESNTMDFLNHIFIDSEAKKLTAHNLLTNSYYLNYISNVEPEFNLTSTTIASNCTQQQSNSVNTFVNLKSKMTTSQSLSSSTLKMFNSSTNNEPKIYCGNNIAGQNGRIQLHNLIKSSLPNFSVGSSSYAGGKMNQPFNELKEGLTNYSNACSLSTKVSHQNNLETKESICNSAVQINQLLNLNPSYSQIIKELMPKFSYPLTNKSSPNVTTILNGHQLHIANTPISNFNEKSSVSSVNTSFPHNHFNRTSLDEYNNDYFINNNNTSLENASNKDEIIKNIVITSSDALSSSSLVSPSSLSTMCTDTDAIHSNSSSNMFSKYPPLKKPCKSLEDSLPLRSKANLTVAQLLEQVEIAKHSQLSVPTSVVQKSESFFDICTDTNNTGVSANNIDNNLVTNNFNKQSTNLPYFNKHLSMPTSYNNPSLKTIQTSLDSIPMPITSPSYSHNLTQSVQKVMRGVNFHNSPPSSPPSSLGIVNLKSSSAVAKQNDTDTRTWSFNLSPSTQSHVNKLFSNESSLSFTGHLTDMLTNHLSINQLDEVYNINSREFNNSEIMLFGEENKNINENNRNFMHGVDPTEFEFVFNAEDENHLDSIIASKDYDDIERLAETLASNIDDCDIDEVMLIGENDSESLEHLKDVSDLIKNDYLLTCSLSTSKPIFYNQINNNDLILSDEKSSQQKQIENKVIDSSSNDNNINVDSTMVNDHCEDNKISCSDSANLEEYLNVSSHNSPATSKKIKKKTVASAKKDNSNNCVIIESGKCESLTDDLAMSNVTRMSTRSSNKVKCMPGVTLTTTTSTTTNSQVNHLPLSTEPLIVLTSTTNNTFKDVENDSCTITIPATVNNFTPTPRRSGRTIKKTELALESTPTRTSEKPRRVSLREHYNNKETDQNNIIHKPSNNSNKIQIISLSIKQDGHGRLSKTKNTPTLRKCKSSNMNNQNVLINEDDESNDHVSVDKKDSIENDRASLSDETLELSVSSDESVPVTKKQKLL